MSAFDSYGKPLRPESSIDPSSELCPVSPSQTPGFFAAGVSLDRRFSINHLTTLRSPLTVDLQLYRQAGVAGIGLNLRKLNEIGLRRSIRRVLESHLAVSSVGWISGLTAPNGHRLKDALIEARRIIRVAGQLRAPTVPVITGPLGGHITTHARRLVVDSLCDLAPLASIYGVRLALQPMNRVYRNNWTFLHQLDETLEILDRIGSPHVMLAFGTSHLLDHPDIISRIPEIAGRTALVSLSDRTTDPVSENQGTVPGTGRLPIAEAVSAFESAGYQGWYEAEVWSPDLWKLDPRDLIQSCLLAKDRLAASLIPC